MTNYYCENGKVLLEANSSLLHTWVLPTKQGKIKFRLHRGSYGFVLMHFALWYNDTIEKLIGKIMDDWSWNKRPIRGSSTRWSNHGGYAIDLNAMRHPLGKSGTMQRVKIRGVRVSAYVLIRARLAWMRGTVSWGGDYRGRKDEMHYENRASLSATEKIARKLADTPRGKAILEANPGQREVIFS